MLKWKWQEGIYENIAVDNSLRNADFPHFLRRD
jgi:hypothetical protein